MYFQNKKTLYLFGIFACLNIGLADDNLNNVTELMQIEVKTYSKGDVSSEGKGGEPVVMDGDYIKNAPSATNTITDLLRGKSYIQYDQASRSSATSGEIAPPKVSINGAKHYESSFLINGVGNNNDINPGGLTDGDYTTQQPTGEAQMLFLDTSLLESVSIYTSSVSAEFGGFLGGVIDAKIKDADTKEWHTMVKTKYTSDSWTKFNWTDKEKSNMNGTSIVKPHAEFTKYEYGVKVDGPLTDNFGLVASYGKQNSKIPYLTNHYLLNADKTRVKTTHRRENENFLLKFNTNGFDDFKASLTGIYAPYTATSSIPNFEDSNYYTKGGGYIFIYDMQNDLSAGTLKSTLNYQKTELSRTANKYVYNWKNDYPNANMYHAMSPTNTISSEGGFGDYTQDKQSIGYKGVFDFDAIKTGMVEHSVKLGAEAEYVSAEGYREDYYSYAATQAVANISAVGSRENGVLEGSQWFKQRTVGIARDRDIDFGSGAVFLEDAINVDRYTLRPGLRVSTDSITDDVNVAYRFFANADVFNDDMLNIYGGLNRYYGTQILTHALHFPAKTYTEKRENFDKPWIASTNASNRGINNLGSLKTPYSDEYNLGASINAFDTNFKVDFANREYKKQISSKLVPETNSIPEHDEFDNSGRSSYWGLTFAVSKDYDLGRGGKHSSSLTATTSRSKTNTANVINSYLDTIGGKDSSLTHVTYNGNLVRKEELPSSGFNRKWVVAYTHTADFFDRFYLTSVLRYQSSAKGLALDYICPSMIPDPNGIDTICYNDVDYKTTFDMDLSANLNVNIGKDRLILGVDIINVLNRKNYANEVYGDSGQERYSTGRQFFANARYEF
ncbi:MAG: TonB-dependent receptor plug domain-containing protein [Campylobacteraceae bacterium]|jgi:hypothetical protein|nr:TonB-dependent receptor plug domain-containing protein [Campylobacteraceae bacterium]